MRVDDLLARDHVCGAFFEPDAPVAEGSPFAALRHPVRVARLVLVDAFRDLLVERVRLPAVRIEARELHGDLHLRRDDLRQKLRDLIFHILIERFETTPRDVVEKVLLDEYRVLGRRSPRMVHADLTLKL